jgi:hypothetical protein
MQVTVPETGCSSEHQCTTLKLACSRLMLHLLDIPRVSIGTAAEKVSLCTDARNHF